MLSSKRSLLLIVGFVIAFLIRVNVGGNNIANSPTAGILFGLCLIVFAFAARFEWRVSPSSIMIGFIGAALVCTPLFLLHSNDLHHHRPDGNFWVWALIVSFVALAEELFLRGSLYDAVKKWKGEPQAIFTAAVVFALLHLPLYGLSSLPLDFTVGLWLGGLKSLSKSVSSPAIAHISADIAGWWLR